jgi:hypothetical protein
MVVCSRMALLRIVHIYTGYKGFVLSTIHQCIIHCNGLIRRAQPRFHQCHALAGRDKAQHNKQDIKLDAFGKYVRLVM